MKKIIYLFTALFIFAGCKKSSFESKFDELPEIRIGNAISEVNTQLTTATEGWIATLPTQAGGGYGFYMKFDAATQEVNMYGDMTDPSATTLRKSTFRVKANAGAELIFDTYNYISLLQDPDPSAFGGVTGAGLRSDVEFIFERSVADSMVFTGKKYRQSLILVKATANERALYEAKGYKTAIDRLKVFFATTKNPYIEIGTGAATINAGITINASNEINAGKRISFTGLLSDNKTIGSAASKFAFKLDGADLLGEGLVFEGIQFVSLRWKDETTLAFYDSADKEYIVRSNPSPLLPLHLLIGSGYRNVVVPNATTYPGWSTDFISRRAVAANSLTRWSIGAGPLLLQDLTFSFNDVTKKMVLVVNTPDGTNAFFLTFNYTYTKSETGVFKFTLGALGGNEGAIAGDLALLLADRINSDKFTFDYFIHPTTGATLAQMTSVEHPDFSFTGAL